MSGDQEDRMSDSETQDYFKLLCAHIHSLPPHRYWKLPALERLLAFSRPYHSQIALEPYHVLENV